MEDKVKELLEGKLDELNLVVDSVVLEKENNNLFLRICLDSSDIIDEKYVLEVYGKSKGSEKDEC